MAESDLQPPQWWSANRVSELLTPVGGVVPVLGSGVSRGADLPDAGQLAEWLLESAPVTEMPADRTGLFPVVDAVDPTRMSGDELRRRVAEYIESFSLRPTPFLAELVQLPSRFIVTFNYDDLVGYAAEEQGLKVCRLSALDRRELLEAHRRLTTKESSPLSELTVLHLHGQARTPETLVLDGASYNELARLPEIEDIVFTLAHFRTLAFVGTTLDEIYLLGVLQKQLNAGFHVVFCRETEVPAVTIRGGRKDRCRLAQPARTRVPLLAPGRRGADPLQARPERTLGTRAPGLARRAAGLLAPARRERKAVGAARPRARHPGGPARSTRA